MPVHSQADWQSGVMMYMQGDQQTSIGTHQQGEDKFTSPHLISCICQGCSRKSCDSANPWIFLWIPGYPGTSASLMCYTQGTQQIPGSVQKGENWQHQLVTTILYNGRDVRSVFSGRLSKPGRCLILFLQDLSSTAARRAAASDTARTPDTAKALKSWDRAATRTVSWKLYSNWTYSLSNSRQIEAKNLHLSHIFFNVDIFVCLLSCRSVCRLAVTDTAYKAWHKMDAKTDVFLTALHCCMNTSSAEEIKSHHFDIFTTFSSNRTVYYHLDFAAWPGADDTGAAVTLCLYLG